MAKLLVIDDKAHEFRKALDVALEDHTILYASDAEEGLCRRSSARSSRKRASRRCGRYGGAGRPCPC